MSISCTNCGKDFEDGDKIRAIEEGIFRKHYGPAACPEADALEITRTIKRVHVNCQYTQSYGGD